jgi:hypothetical protein
MLVLVNTQSGEVFKIESRSGQTTHHGAKPFKRLTPTAAAKLAKR